MTRQDRVRTLLGSLLLAAAISAPSAHAEPVPWTPDDVRDALSRTSPTVACIVQRELGPQLDPYAVGAAGEIGPAQLLPVRGLLPDFQYGAWVDLAPAFRDPNSPYMAVAYLESALDRGMGPNWSTFAGCVR